jgi:hypothetical protein
VDRWLTRGLALVVIGLVVMLAMKSTPARPPPIAGVEDAGADAQPSADGGGATGTASDAGTGAASEGGLLLGDMKDLDMPGDGGPSSLPSSAPRQVHVGVVLVTYSGAQGAPATARSKAEAKDLAERLATDAKTDFHGAVQRGDNGSSDDIGRVPRGVLEAPTELVVFTMSAGTVSSVIETPRGFWIVKRID